MFKKVLAGIVMGVVVGFLAYQCVLSVLGLKGNASPPLAAVVAGFAAVLMTLIMAIRAPTAREAWALGFLASGILLFALIVGLAVDDGIGVFEEVGSEVGMAAGAGCLAAYLKLRAPRQEAAVVEKILVGFILGIVGSVIASWDISTAVDLKTKAGETALWAAKLAAPLAILAEALSALTMRIAWARSLFIVGILAFALPLAAIVNMFAQADRPHADAYHTGAAVFAGALGVLGLSSIGVPLGMVCLVGYFRLRKPATSRSLPLGVS